MDSPILPRQNFKHSADSRAKASFLRADPRKPRRREQVRDPMQEQAREEPYDTGAGRVGTRCTSRSRRDPRIYENRSHRDPRTCESRSRGDQHTIREQVASGPDAGSRSRRDPMQEQVASGPQDTIREQVASGPEEAYDTGVCLLSFRRKSDDLLLKFV